MPPYASVIIPTHDRAATLATTVQSVQRQTIQDIEIIVVADGATDEVIEVGRALAGTDARVRLLDLPKAPGRGAANRDFGVRSAGAERIFYTDDDDVWLPHHVATLGPALDEVEFVDSLAVSVSVTGRLYGTLGHAAHPSVRALVSQRRFKLQYDTHVAHRRSAYLALGEAWAEDGVNDIVHTLFSAFAGAPSVRWRSLSAPTALSLHGAGRVAFTAEERNQEIAFWLERTSAMTSDDLLAELTYEPTFLRTLRQLNPEADEDATAYLARTGVAMGVGGDDALALPIDEANKRRLNDVFALFARKPTTNGLSEIILPALDPLLQSRIATGAMVRMLQRAVGLAGALRLIQSLETNHHRDETFRGLLESSLLLKLSRFAEAQSSAESVLAKTRFDKAFAHRHLAQALLANAQPELAIAHLDAADEKIPASFSDRRLRVRALIAAKRLEAAAELIERLQTERPDDDTVKKLRDLADRQLS